MKFVQIIRCNKSIKLNEHLPEISTAPEAMNQGYDVSEMNARLLQKVEELTLYVLQLNEKIIALEKEGKK